MSSEEIARIERQSDIAKLDGCRPMTITRKIGETIAIGDSIELQLRKIDHRFGVSLGIEAPKEALIFRGEIYKANQANRAITLNFV